MFKSLARQPAITPPFGITRIPEPVIQHRPEPTNILDVAVEKLEADRAFHFREMCHWQEIEKDARDRADYHKMIGEALEQALKPLNVSLDEKDLIADVFSSVSETESREPEIAGDATRIVDSGANGAEPSAASQHKPRRKN